MNDPKLTRQHLISHFGAYPELQTEDIFKFLFQSTFGCEHMISSLRHTVPYGLCAVGYRLWFACKPCRNGRMPSAEEVSISRSRALCACEYGDHSNRCEACLQRNRSTRSDLPDRRNR